MSTIPFGYKFSNLEIFWGIYGKNAAFFRKAASQFAEKFAFSIVRKYIKISFLSYFSVKKSTKSQQGGLAASSLQTSGGVHELAARISAWRVRAANGKAKVGSIALSATSAIPRVRTYHTK